LDQQTKAQILKFSKRDRLFNYSNDMLSNTVGSFSTAGFGSHFVEKEGTIPVFKKLNFSEYSDKELNFFKRLFEYVNYGTAVSKNSNLNNNSDNFYSVFRGDKERFSSLKKKVVGLKFNRKAKHLYKIHRAKTKFKINKLSKKQGVVKTNR
jgi:hypothetical protein